MQTNNHVPCASFVAFGYRDRRQDTLPVVVVVLLEVLVPARPCPWHR
jgi:hypothetical protein